MKAGNQTAGCRRQMGMRTPKPLRVALSAAIAASLLGACSSDSATPTSTTSGTTGTTRTGGRLGFKAFEQFSDCNSLLAHLKEIGLERVGPYGFGFGGMYGDVMPMPASAEGGAATTAAAATAAPNRQQDTAASAPKLGSADESSSGTNTQEAGVDEGDQVENDGKYVYTVLDGMNLRVVDIDSGKIASTVSLEPGSHQLVLSGKRLAVVSSGWNDRMIGIFHRGTMPSQVSHGVTTVALYDVSDPASPKKLSESGMEGDALSVRRRVTCCALCCAAASGIGSISSNRTAPANRPRTRRRS